MTEKITITGSVTSNPPSACSTFPSFAKSLPFNEVKNLEKSLCKFEQISVASPSFQDLLAGSSISQVKLFAMKVSGGSLLLRVSSTDGGADQLIPVSGLVIWTADQTGQELTAMAVQGTASLEFFVAGS